MIVAYLTIRPACSSVIGNVIPETIKIPVINRPTFSTPFPNESLIKSCVSDILLHIALGKGARTYITTTDKGSQLENKAHERIDDRKPIDNRKLNKTIM